MHREPTHQPVKGDDRTVSEFVSESITPLEGTFDTARMALGEPGLPGGFRWRAETFQVVEKLSAWKESTREGGRPDGELYLRRHYYKIRMSNRSTWTVYLIRQASGCSNPKKRWFLYLVEYPKQR